MNAFTYQNSVGESKIEPSTDLIIEDLLKNKAGCFHFLDGTQLAISFINGITVLELSRIPHMFSVIQKVVKYLGLSMERHKLCGSNELINLFEDALRRVSK